MVNGRGCRLCMYVCIHCPAQAGVESNNALAQSFASELDSTGRGMCLGWWEGAPDYHVDGRALKRVHSMLAPFAPLIYLCLSVCIHAYVHACVRACVRV